MLIFFPLFRAYGLSYQLISCFWSSFLFFPTLHNFTYEKGERAHVLQRPLPCLWVLTALGLLYCLSPPPWVLPQPSLSVLQ